MSSIPKYKRSSAEAKSWDEIESFYADLVLQNWPLDNIIQMIQAIKADDQLHNKLFACTSLDKLVISIYNPIELYREAVHMQYNREKELWNFKYYSLPNHKPEYERSYPGELLIEKFRNYINVLGW